MRHRSRASRRRFAFALAVVAPLVFADAPKPPEVHIGIEASDVAIDLEISGKDALGFTHRQRSATEREAVDRVLHTLSSTSEWIRFNPEAQCLFSSSSIGANIYRSIDPDAPPPKPPITKPSFEAHFVFHCRAMSALRSVDLAFIAQFPRVREITVDLTTPASHREEKIIAPNATISLTQN